MKTTTTTRPRFLLAGSLALGLALTGCMADATASGTTSHAGSCTQLPAVGKDTPTVALLGGIGPGLLDHRPDVDAVLAASSATGARVIVNGVAGGPGAPNLLANVVMTGEGSNKLLGDRNLDCKTRLVTDAIASLAQQDAPERYDTFDALRALAGNLENAPSDQPVDVVLMAPLAAAGGGVDLADPATLANPDEAINTLAREQLMPPSCQNWRIYGVGGGRGLDDVRAVQLREFWRRYAQKCGGRLVAWTDHLATFPATAEVAPADTSQIAVERTPETVTATLGSDVLFEANSATLQAAVEGPLTELLALARAYPGRIVLTGHINVVGPADSASGDRLSLDRSDAVKAWLVAHGIDGDRITTVGVGMREPVYPSPTTEAERQANRRVVAVIHTQD